MYIIFETTYQIIVIPVIPVIPLCCDKIAQIHHVAAQTTLSIFHQSVSSHPGVSAKHEGGDNRCDAVWNSKNCCGCGWVSRDDHGGCWIYRVSPHPMVATWEKHIAFFPAKWPFFRADPPILINQLGLTIPLPKKMFISQLSLQSSCTKPRTLRRILRIHRFSIPLP